MRAALIVVTLFLASCSPVRPLSPLAYRACPAAQGEWNVMNAPPANASVLISLVKDEIHWHSYESEPRLFWFQHGPDSMLLCRAAIDAPSSRICKSDAWQFNKIADDWVPDGYVLETVCIGAR